MSESNEKAKPVADLYAIIEGADPNDKSKWIPIGALFRNRDGSLGGEMHSEPLAWRRGGSRQLQVRFREEKAPQAGSSDNGGRTRQARR